MSTPQESDTPSPEGGWGRTLSVRYVSVDWLKPYDGNAKLHPPEQVERLKQSIVRFGFTNPILAMDDGTVIAGHGRLIAALQLGMGEVPCIVLDGLSQDEARAYCLADNRLADLGEWDASALEAELLALGDVDQSLLADAGFTEAEVTDILSTDGELPEAGEDDVGGFRCPHCGKPIGDE